ncbi:IclR family transcriptional regulator [Geoalkalibacter halelectricus]|uniref:IclR family transcriptional regulator n=1 Tax=Geoalkalibacter halelectricus TaxID=2847045 RepID=A0ABY5ZPC8_9BACT|nr:IclR family transcriptional regulator [Geoalkalibacter halelectricus]MDO3380282.1 IclR family transcriptional regulator [Geoalkalibacter halelectricus]UWZ79549.1 IclR family transcriptional regulator [Geoalkalibacter halelectricus]
MAREKASYSIQSVERALCLLEILGEEGDELRIVRLSERLDMDRARVFRLLATFEQRGYVERVGTSGRYRLGLPVFEMGQKILQRMSLLRKAKPVMERLARQCDEAVYLAIPHGEEILMLDMVDTTQKVGTVSLVGQRFPLADTAAGRVVIEGRRVCARGGYGELAAWREVRDRGALGEGVSSLAVPVLDARGEVQASLCLIGPDFRFEGARLGEELLPLLREAAAVISSRLGFINH